MLPHAGMIQDYSQVSVYLLLLELALTNQKMKE
jgi:hypothetical protein